MLSRRAFFKKTGMTALGGAVLSVVNNVFPEFAAGATESQIAPSGLLPSQLLPSGVLPSGIRPSGIRR